MISDSGGGFAGGLAAVPHLVTIKSSNTLRFVFSISLWISAEVLRSRTVRRGITFPLACNTYCAISLPSPLAGPSTRPRTEKDLPAEMKSKIDEQVEIFWKGITNSAGSFLHHGLDDKKHTQEQVKTLVQCIPESLSHGEVDSMYIECAGLRINLPIHAAIWDLYHNDYNTKAISFIPLLAEEGAKLNVGGADRRGGLLYPNDDEENVLQLLVSCYISEGYRYRPGLDLLCLNVMKSLREANGPSSTEG
jgi:hypothetical protein